MGNEAAYKNLLALDGTRRLKRRLKLVEAFSRTDRDTAPWLRKAELIRAEMTRREREKDEVQ